jgi:iron complex transport system ATP-binding protein
MNMRLENVSYSVGPKYLVRGVNLSVNPGELSVIIGPNGAGKSTALSLLSGDLKPSSGQVFIDGAPLSDLSYGEQAIKRGVLPQLGHAGFEFSALDIVLMGRIPHGETPESDRALKIALAAMGQTKTLNLKDQSITTLSGGERQRVNLARVLAQVWSDKEVFDEPRYILLDEPISALDPRYQIDVLTMLKSYCDRGCGILAVLHDMSMAAMFADKICIMDEGNVLHTGAPKQVMTSEILSDIWQLSYSVQHIDGGLQPVIFNSANT